MSSNQQAPSWSRRWDLQLSTKASHHIPIRGPPDLRLSEGKSMQKSELPGHNCEPYIARWLATFRIRHSRKLSLPQKGHIPSRKNTTGSNEVGERSYGP